MIKVSIIIPVYMVEEYLPACLDSVLDQSLKDIEVICIDDASPDRCGVILDDYAERDARVRVLHLPENHQQGYGRNRGLEMAGGKYVYFLDSDDMITPNAMEELYELCERDALDGVFFDSQVLYATEELRKTNHGYPCLRQGNYPDEVMTGTALMDQLIQKDEWLVYVQREFWLRSFLLENQIWFPEGTEHEDELFSFKTGLLARRVRYVRKDYFIRRYRENSVMTRKPNVKDFHGYFCTFCEMADFVKEYNLDTIGVRRTLFHLYILILKFLDVFEGVADPDVWFSAEVGKVYRFFLAMRKAQEAMKAEEYALWSPLDRYREIWIYGAGRVARTACQRLENSGHIVSRFMVTKLEGNPETMNGIRVESVHTIDKQTDGSVVLVAISEGLRAEPIEILKGKGFRYFTFAANRLEGPFDTEEP